MCPVVSIIVPVFNVEKYLEKCIKSLMDQTIKDIEIILVDDGSKDSSGVICDKYKNLDKRIVVIHKTNGGLSDARNAGLDVASGKYIGFVDGDDYASPDMYCELVDFMEANSCDLVECSVNYIQGDKIVMHKPKANQVMTGTEALKIHLKGNSKENIPRVAVWSKLFKRDFWDSRRFPVGKIHEDYFLTTQALFTSKRVGLLRKGLYFHVVDNKNSIMNSKFSERDLFREEQYRLIKNYLFQNKAYDLAELAENRYWMLILSLTWKCYANNLDEKLYKDMLIQYKKSILRIHKVSLQRHNHKSQQKPSQPTLKRRCFFVKSDVFLWPGFGKQFGDMSRGK